MTRFKNHLRFAIHKEDPQMRAPFPPNRSERIGNLLSWFVYEFRSMAVNIICEPRFVTVCLTSFAMIFTALLFYPTETWQIISKIGGEIVEHINWKYCRFALWVMSEVTILGVGFRAFGRFSNRKLMDFHRIG